MSERASCAGCAAGLASTGMTTAELERPAIDRRHRLLSSRSSHGGDEIAPSSPRCAGVDDTVTHPARRRGTRLRRGRLGDGVDRGGGPGPARRRQQERVVDGWRGLHRATAPASSSTAAATCASAASPLGAAAREGLLHWLPLSQLELALLDGGLFADDPAGAIALLVRPPTIWRREDARRAELLFPRAPRFEPERFAAIEEWARRGSSRAPDPPARGRAADRGAASRPVGCATRERDGRRRLRGDRRGRRPLQGGGRTAARTLCLERGSHSSAPRPGSHLRRHAVRRKLGRGRYVVAVRARSERPQRRTRSSSRSGASRRR